MSYEIQKKLIGSLNQNTEFIEASVLQTEFNSLSSMLSTIVLNKSDDNIYALYDVVGKILTKFAGTYETLSKHANSYELAEQLNEIVSKQPIEVQEEIETAKAAAKAADPSIQDNSEDLTAISLKILAKKYSINIEDVLGEGKTEPRTEDDEFKLQQAINAKII